MSEHVTASSPNGGTTSARLLSIPKVADRLDCSKEHVYDLIARGLIATVDIGVNRSKTRVSEDELAAYIVRKTTKARRVTAAERPRTA